jgi:hypothetical protein
MTVAPHELLGRMAGTLRGEIGPAVGESFAKTQAFMAAVILTKLAGQLAAAEADARAAADDHRAVVATFSGVLDGVGDGPADLTDAARAFAEDSSDASWNRLVRAVYAGRDELGAQRFDALLGCIRGALRARLDRALAYAS